MNKYVLDARLIHSLTIKMIEQGEYQNVICVSDKIAHSYTQKYLLKQILGPNRNCEFLTSKQLNLKEIENSFVVLDSLYYFETDFCDKVTELTITYTDTYDKKVELYGDSLYLCEKDKDIINDLLAKGIAVYYQPNYNYERILFSEFIEGELC